MEKPKQYLYHWKPEDMRKDNEGREILHPLNTLKEMHPDLYVKKAEKYADRQEIMEQFIPTLEAAWSDTLFFSAVDPHEIKQALIEAGAEPKEMKFYQLDAAHLDPKHTTVYLYQEPGSEDKMIAEHFLPYDPEHLDEHAVLPQETKEYYKEVIKKGGQPLLFVGVPQILHKGSLDVSNLDVITV